MKKISLFVMLSITLLTLSVSAKTKKHSKEKSVDPYAWLYPMCRPGIFDVTDPATSVYVNREGGLGYGAPVLKEEFIVDGWSYRALQKRIDKQQRKTLPISARKDPWRWLYPYLEPGVLDQIYGNHYCRNRENGDPKGAPKLQEYMVIRGSYAQLCAQVERQKRGQ